MEKYTVQPPRLEPVEVEAYNTFHACCKAVNVWKRAMLHYAAKQTAKAADKKEAAPAVGADRDGKWENNQGQDTTVPARGQHECEWLDEETCLCKTCRRGFADEGDGSCCCGIRFGNICPVAYCPDYLPEEAVPC